MSESKIIYNTKGKQVGIITVNNTGEKTYLTKRDFNKGQIFMKMKYHKVAIDREILKVLAREGVKGIMFYILNFEKENFYLQITLEEFLNKSETINYDKSEGSLSTRYGEQRVICFHDCERFYPDQKRILEF